ncbi:uncharacterized protein EURHEDRAFT_382987 [Aspergillus ruber CBS 135680]|uniref:Uncharacterized protein n=1 Tax=Aspergillus ruber (strain CBS 135680) TaxID=1388766 RepID=A0A017SP57_ASPRC|nr:uncharacterized protein EURHEDRAFT_382987 [Aspergillus ruber CBS 135680]EYE98773.1 hypothetical protein EURHEDRAFT_382987 [Aspergillus ruber CBS 135680]
MQTRPSFDQLPLRPDDPTISAWRLWGEEDQVGTLNLIDADSVQRGAGEIRLGLRLSLNWSLDMPRTPDFGRQGCKFTHRVHHGDLNLVTLDDEGYTERNGKTYDPAQQLKVTHDELMECLTEQERLSGHPIELPRGDVLLIRSGYTKRYMELSGEEERKGTSVPPRGVRNKPRYPNAAVPLGQAGCCRGWRCAGTGSAATKF